MNSKIIGFAIESHSNTNHLYDGKPYSIHLAMVAMYAQKYFQHALISPNVHDTILSACWLHDTIEDCRLTYNDIKEVAGEDVAEIVYAVSNEKGKTRKERANEKYYKGIIDTPWATYVKMCDRLANVRYSKDVNSRMIQVYRNENALFLRSLFPNGVFVHLKPMVSELCELLETENLDS